MHIDTARKLRLRLAESAWPRASGTGGPPTAAVALPEPQLPAIPMRARQRMGCISRHEHFCLHRLGGGNVHGIHAPQRACFERLNRELQQGRCDVAQPGVARIGDQVLFDLSVLRRRSPAFASQATDSRNHLWQGNHAKRQLVGALAPAQDVFGSRLFDTTLCKCRWIEKNPHQRIRSSTMRLAIPVPPIVGGVAARCLKDGTPDGIGWISAIGRPLRDTRATRPASTRSKNVWPDCAARKRWLHASRTPLPVAPFVH